MRPNIYPRTVKNIKAVLLYYFPKTSHSEIDKYAERLYDQRILQLNEIEYGSYIISKNRDLISQHYKVSNLNMLLSVIREVLFKDESTWGREDRRRKLKGIKEGLKY